MADESQERTEEATPKKKDQTREQGKVARSKDLNTAVLLIASSVAIIAFGQHFATYLGQISQHAFSFERADIYDDVGVYRHIYYALTCFLKMLSPFFIVVIIAMLATPILMGGWIFSMKAVSPKFDKLNPLKGLKRMISMNSMVELVKSFGKVGVVASVAILLLSNNVNELLDLSNSEVNQSILHGATIFLWLALKVGASLMVIALIDVPYQLWEFNKNIKMTKQEVKDEFKNTEGSPEQKGRIRSVQQRMANARMMAEVPKADVIITNPEHYSVALRYDDTKKGAPIVVAKGVDIIAFQIRKVAKAHDITIVETPPLARAIYHTCELNHEIPEALYVCVARLLAYVYQLKRYENGGGDKPEQLGDLPIPDDYQY